MIDLALLDEEDEEQATEEGDFVPAAALGPSHPDGKRKRDHLLGPSCPICGDVLGPFSSNQELNDHVDWCLNKDAIRKAGQATPKKAKRPKPPDRQREGDRGMLQWLNRK